MDNLNNTGESAAEPQNLTADSTPETDAIATDAATDGTNDDIDNEQGSFESDTGDESAGTEAAETAESADSATEPDLLDESEPNPYFTDDEIKNFRLPKPARAKFTEIQQRAIESEKKLERVGGDLAVETLAPLGAILGKTEATSDELNAFIDALADANPLIGAQVLQGAVASMFEAPEYADSFLAYRFGSQKANIATIEKTVKLLDQFETDIDHVAELLKLDKAGVLDTEYARSQFSESFGDSDLYNKMLAKQQDMERRIQELSDPANARTTAQPQVDSTRIVGEFETDFSKTVSESVDAVIGRFHWGNGALASLVRSVVAQELRGTENYGQTVEFIRATGQYRNGDKLGPLPQTKLALLKNAAEARTLATVRQIQKDLQVITQNAAKAAKSVRTAQTDQQTTEANAQAKTVTMPKGRPLTTEEQLAKAREQYLNSIRASQSAAKF